MEIAEDVMREFLNIYSTDLAALELLGKMYMRVDQFELAENIFRRALELAPSFRRARLGYVSALHKQLKPEEENRQLDILLQDEPDNAEYRALKAMALSACGKVEEAVAYCEDMLRTEPELHRFWLVYAHTLRVSGRRENSIAAYRKAIHLEPRLGEAWWGLANLKTFRFSPADVETMRRGLTRDDLTGENGEFLHFALGKAARGYLGPTKNCSSNTVWATPPCGRDIPTMSVRSPKMWRAKSAGSRAISLPLMSARAALPRIPYSSWVFHGPVRRSLSRFREPPFRRGRRRIAVPCRYSPKARSETDRPGRFVRR